MLASKLSPRQTFCGEAWHSATPVKLGGREGGRGNFWIHEEQHLVPSGTAWVVLVDMGRKVERCGGEEKKQQKYRARSARRGSIASHAPLKAAWCEARGRAVHQRNLKFTSEHLSSLIYTPRRQHHHSPSLVVGRNVKVATENWAIVLRQLSLFPNYSGASQASVSDGADSTNAFSESASRHSFLCFNS